MTLYEMTDSYLELLEMMENGADKKMVEDAMKAIDDQFPKKAESYIVLILEREAESEKCDKEIKRLQARKKRADDDAKNMKESLINSILAMKKKKVKTEFHEISLKNNPASLKIKDAAMVPKKYLTPQPPKINNSQIKEDMQKQGIVECDYAYLEKGVSLVIE
ncbi:siphovirus Gp157 family protein [Ruminococcus sp. CLA-AA-H200]|uniref:Siphovirus Gp157 family protein n=1 Tax=Ruminococcus turbiniformis TaxID=2881258 RepID=A0ABS8FX46_9FIRM|nr:siphovirus Gp157 family protein [Ruminococcus turbiniformis]MCC2254601.1 siphovirus Gp157 family protein [Ruminococcus turbiniformis]